MRNSPGNLGIHLSREMEIIEIFVIHLVKGFSAVEEEKVEFLIPHKLEQLIPLIFLETDNHLVIETIQFHSVFGLIQDEL